MPFSGSAFERAPELEYLERAVNKWPVLAVPNPFLLEHTLCIWIKINDDALRNDNTGLARPLVRPSVRPVGRPPARSPNRRTSSRLPASAHLLRLTAADLAEKEAGGFGSRKDLQLNGQASWINLFAFSQLQPR